MFLSLLNSHVVYSFTYQCCTELYVDPTTRHLDTLISNHLGVAAILVKGVLIFHLLVFCCLIFPKLATLYLLKFYLLVLQPPIKKKLLISTLAPSLNGNISFVHHFLY